MEAVPFAAAARAHARDTRTTHRSHRIRCSAHRSSDGIWSCACARGAYRFTYQAMVHDLLAVDGERYSYHYVGNNNQRLSKEVLLNDTDPL